MISESSSPKVNAMPRSRMSYVIAALMFAAGAGASVARPAAKVADERPALSLAAMVPLQFGEWREVPMRQLQVVNPQTQALLDKIYTEVLTRTYVNEAGYGIMLSIAYGSDQRGSLQAHKPEVCYPAQGFNLQKNEAGELATAYGSIPVRRLFGNLGRREEPITYWFTVGDHAVQGTTQKRLVELRYGLTGRIPDGLLFRISSIDGNQPRAFGMQDRFANQLLQALGPAERLRLSGLRGAAAN
jgi:EpsI family protein